MAGKTIKQRIALDGGDEIRDEFKALGTAGEQAFKKIGAAINAKALQADLKRLGESFKGLQSAFAKVGRNLGLITVAAAAAGTAITLLAKGGAEAADAAGKAAQSLGLQVEEYGKLKFAMEQSGGTAETLATAMNFLNKSLGKVSDGGLGDALDGATALGVTVRRYGSSIEKSAAQTDNAGTAFAKLGIRLRDANGSLRSNNDILLDIADAFAKLPNGAEKSALAMQLFGRSGADILPFLNEGRIGLEALGLQAEKTGSVFTAEQARIGQAFADSLGALSKARQGVQDQLGLVFAPVLTEGADALTNAITANRDALLSLARDGLAKVVPLMQDFLNAILGKDELVRSTWVLELRDAIVQFAQSAQAAITGILIPAFNALLAVFDTVAGAINSVIGTEFTGQQLLIAAGVLQLVGVFGLLGATITTLGALLTALTTAFGPLVVALALAGIAAAVFWEDLAAAGEKATLDARAQAHAIGEAFARGWVAIGEGAVGAFAVAWDGIAAGAAGVIDVVAGIFTAGVQTIGAIWQGISDVVTSIWDSTAAAIGTAAQAITDAIASATELAGDTDATATIAEGLVAPFRVASETIGAIWDGITQIAQTGFDGILSTADGAISGLGRVAQAITNKLRSELDALISTLNAAMSRIISAIDRAISRLKKAAAEAKSSGGSGGSDKGFALGGLIRGAGTGTSDSIPIWASDGEFMMRRAVVKKYGLQFMRLLNAGRLSLEQLRGAMPKFADGGLIGGLNLGGIDLDGLLEGLAGALGGNVLAPKLAIAGGGSIAPASSGRPVALTIAMPGLSETFHLLAPAEVAEKISRFTVGAQTRSAGRKPGWAR